MTSNCEDCKWYFYVPPISLKSRRRCKAPVDMNHVKPQDGQACPYFRQRAE